MKRFILLSTALACTSACQRSANVLESIEEGPPHGEGGGDTNSPNIDTFTAAVSSLAAGDSHTCLSSEGRLFCFGRGSDGALGSGNVDNQLHARRIGTRTDVVMVSAGTRSTCILSEDGAVECTGAGTSGQLGNGVFRDSLDFVAVSLNARAVSLASGFEHNCAILDVGALWCWGANAEGQLGQNDPFSGPGPSSAVPVRVGADAQWTWVTGGQGHSCGIHADGSLWCWGRNSALQLGLGDGSAGQLRTPTRVGAASDWVRVEAGQNHTCGVRRGGKLECWGDNESGQLGTGDREPRSAPTEVIASGVDLLALDTFHTCVRLSGRVHCAGRGTEGELGKGTTAQISFEEVPTSIGAELVTVGRFHTCIAFAEGAACTGANDSGNLGVGDATRRSQLTRLLAADSF